MMSSRIACLAVLLICSIASQWSSAQDSPQVDIFSKNTVIAPERMATYQIELGLREQKNLNLLEHRNQLDESQRLRKLILDDALAPINDMLESEFFTLDALEKLFSDKERSKIVSVALGDEVVSRLIAERTLKSLFSLEKNSQNHGYEPTSFLYNKVVTEYLSLSDEQIVSLKQLKSDYAEKLRHGSKTEFDQLDSLLSKHWEDLLAVLNEQQKQMAHKLIGSPVCWFRSFGRSPLRHRDQSRELGEVILPGKHVNERTGDGRSLHQMTPEELESRGISFLHSHAVEMIKSPFFWDEIEMTSDQRQALQALALADVLSLPNSQRIRLRELVAGGPGPPLLVKDKLTVHQQEEFCQFELQLLGSKYESSVCLLMPEIEERLSLTSSQVITINDLATTYSAKADKYENSIELRRDVIFAEFKKAAEQVLTETQTELYSKLIGR